MTASVQPKTAKFADLTAGTLHLDGWAGRLRIPVQVIGETRTKYRVRLGSDAMLPGRRHCEAGDEVLVPKYAVTIEETKTANFADLTDKENRP